MQLLATLGRGIQRPDDVSLWVLTEDLEVLADDGAHPIIRRPIDDFNPNCVIGGGELNLLASLELCKKYLPRLVVFAYAHRAKYLKKVDGPSESSVMYREFCRRCDSESLLKISVDVWPTKEDRDGLSNSRTEVINIIELALQKGYSSVGIVSVMIQLPRARLFAERYLKEKGIQNKVLVEFFSSELVLVQSDPVTYGPRVLKMFSSQAFARNAIREGNGVNNLLAGGEWAYEAWRPSYASVNAQK